MKERVILLLLIILTAVYIDKFLLIHSPDLKKSVVEGKFDFPKNLTILQSGYLEIDHQKYIFVSFFVDPLDFKKNITHPVYLYPMNDDGTLAGFSYKFGTAEHIRHISRLNTPWGEGVVLADHGVDNVELNQGGKILLIVKNKITGKLEDLSFKLKLERNFSFNVVTPKRAGIPYNDILVIPYNTDISRPVYLQAMSNGYVDSSNLLPVDWRNKSVCFMTGITLDFNHSGTDDVLLGGCDQDVKMNPTLKDQILSWENKSWKWNLETAIPLRKKEKGWGTVYLESSDLNNDGFLDVVALTHDWGFHQGMVQIFFQSHEKSKRIFQDIAIRNWPLKLLNTHHYLHKVISYDVDGDGLLDLVGQINYIDQNYILMPNIFVLLNKNGHWEYSENVFKLPHDKFVVGIDKVKFNYLSKESLMFIFNNGEYKIY